MLEQLEEKFSDEITTLEKEEKNTPHAYELMMQALHDDTKTAEQQIGRKSTHKAAEEQKSADAQGMLKDTQANKAADTKYAKDTKAECAGKEEAFHKRAELRDGEVQAINQALEILKGNAVTGYADTHLPGLIQKSKKASSKHTSFIQLRGSVQSVSAEQEAITKKAVQQAIDNALKDRVAEFLTARALATHS